MKDIYSEVNTEAKSAYVDTHVISQNSYANGYSDGFKVDAFLQNTGPNKSLHPSFRNITKSDLKRGILLSEILGRPKGW